MKIADIGCGSGRLLESLSNYDSYIGMDASAAMIDEANKQFPDAQFIVGAMPHVPLGVQIFDIIFFIASFHHLSSLDDRINTLKNISHHCHRDTKICMTNWSLLQGPFSEKYKNNRILDSKNEFAAYDYNIPFDGFDRYYHGFTLEELEYIATKAGFTVIENRIFEGERNIITVLQKS